MDPDTLLNCGRANRRLHRLVCDIEVWRSLLKGIGSFTKERLEELVKFGLRDEQSLEMRTEVVKEVASRFKLHLGIDATGKKGEARISSCTVAVSIQGWGSPDTFEMGGDSDLEELNRVAQTVGSKFTIKEVKTFGPLLMGCRLPCQMVNLKTIRLISDWVDQQGEEGMDNLDFHSVWDCRVMGILNQDLESLFSLLETSKDWKIQTLRISQWPEYWTALARSTVCAPAGHIGTLELTIYKGDAEKVCKEDVQKVWEMVKVMKVKVLEVVGGDPRDPNWGITDDVLIGGGGGEEPKTSWEEAYDTVLNNIC